MPLKDPQKRREYRRQYATRYLQDPKVKALHAARVSKRNKQHLAAIDELLYEFKKRGCSACPEMTPVCIDAHHVSADTKDFNIGDARSNKLALKWIVAELEKCVPLCANCHRKLHAKLDAVQPEMATEAHNLG